MDTEIRAGGCADLTKPWGFPAAAGCEPGQASNHSITGPGSQVRHRGLVNPRAVTIGPGADACGTSERIEPRECGSPLAGARPMLTAEERDALLAPGLYFEAEA